VEFQSLFAKLIADYRINARFLPWRTSRDPYQIWVSEVILQQTKVLQGQDYFMTFLRYFPDVFSLADAPEDQVLKVWEGLGYYSRAINMHHSAKFIVEQLKGRFPDDFDGIRKLKGVGDYTAAAISSIAFDLPHAAVDGNVKRVASRLFGIREPIDKPAGVKQITELLNEIIQYYSPGEFNQAIMELGALICTPKNPDCRRCPMQEHCFAFANNLQKSLPVVTPKKKPVNMHIEFLFLESKGKTWLHKRDKNGIWKGLFEFPAKIVNHLSETPPVWMMEFLDNSDVSKVLGHRDYVHKLTHRTIFARFWHLSGKPSNIVKQNQTYTELKTTEISGFPVHRLMLKYLGDNRMI